MRDLGIQSIMVNSNPETVSTDYDTSDMLFFEPLTTEDVLNICDRLIPMASSCSSEARLRSISPRPSKRRASDHRYQPRDDRRG